MKRVFAAVILAAIAVVAYAAGHGGAGHGGGGGGGNHPAHGCHAGAGRDRSCNAPFLNGYH